MAMKMTEIGLADEVFTHIGADGHQTTYAVNALWARCQMGDIEKVWVPVDFEHAKFCVEARGVEGERLVELVAHPEWMAKALMFVALPDGSMLLVDGTHRYVALYSLALSQAPAYLIPWVVAKDFIIDDVPQTDEKVLMGHSHLTALRKIVGTGS
jgi:hypothetical protein